MKAKDIQEGIGETGRFGEFFIGLGALIFLGGLGMVLSAWLGFPFPPMTGEEPVHQAIQAGGLFMMEGLGFVVFGVVAIRAGWGRHHPGSDL